MDKYRIAFNCLSFDGTIGCSQCPFSDSTSCINDIECGEVATEMVKLNPDILYCILNDDDVDQLIDNVLWTI